MGTIPLLVIVACLIVLPLHPRKRPLESAALAVVLWLAMIVLAIH